MQIRQVGPEDWADWRLMRQRSLSEDPWAFSRSTAMWSGDCDTEANWRERLAAPGACFLAYDGDVAVAMVGARPAESDVELISMWVAAEVRGRGVGGELIDAVIGWAGDRPISLRVIDGNEAAIGVYESRDFVLQPGCADVENCRLMTRTP